MNKNGDPNVELEVTDDELDDLGDEQAEDAPKGKSKPGPPKGQRPLRSINDIISDLSKPIKARHLRQKVRAGQRLDFIPWYHAIKYLDLYAPGWSYEVRHALWNNEGRLVLTVRLSFPCLEGVVYRDATGTEEEPEEGERMYGDPSSNAESMALRRAAAKFGLGLYLYNKERNTEGR
ncbi:MAG: DUF1071 domain-containing protein [Acidobacteria bacterium]|nr:DUF1071 domain-containing protein [Acidobacteriota bacterium]MBI3426548.1 DUF1071 domain-containing protein [Acidobacteriota bacterium]